MTGEILASYVTDIIDVLEFSVGQVWWTVADGASCNRKMKKILQDTSDIIAENIFPDQKCSFKEREFNFDTHYQSGLSHSLFHLAQS